MGIFFFYSTGTVPSVSCTITVSECKSFFVMKEVPCNLHNKELCQLPSLSSRRYGIKSLSFRESLLWNALSDDQQLTISLRKDMLLGWQQLYVLHIHLSKDFFISSVISYIVYYMLYTMYCISYAVYCMMHIVYCTLYIVYYSLYIVCCTLYTVYFMLYIVCCIFLVVRCVLYTVYIYIGYCML